jgi:hypothetical protein
MSPHNRVLVLVGGAAIIASAVIAIVFIQTDATDARLHIDQTNVHTVQVLGDQLLTEVHDQREALDEYLMSGDPRPLARYQLAALNEAETAGQIVIAMATLSEAGLSGLGDSLERVAAENDTWRATVAAPAIAAVQAGSGSAVRAGSGSAVRAGSGSAVRAAIEKEIVDNDTTQSAAGDFVIAIDSQQAVLGARSDALDGLRFTATTLGIVIELLAAGLSLWFVRRFGLTVMRDTRRRIATSEERGEIIASLRLLRTESSPETTALFIAEALHRLPGVDFGAVLEWTGDGLRALAIAGLPGFPIQTGDALPDHRARYLRERSIAGPWAERWTPATRSDRL